MKFLKAISTVCVLLFIAELIIVVGSWLGSAIYPGSGIVSLLSPEGIRWFVGEFTTMMATPLLMMLLLCSATYGIVVRSGIVQHLYAIVSQRSLRVKDYRERIAMQVSIVVASAMVAVIGWLTLSPHAILLSVTGSLSNSSFSSGIVPLLSFFCSFVAVTYGMLSSSFQSYRQIFDSMVDGVEKSAFLFVFYLFAAQLYLVIGYVFHA